MYICLEDMTAQKYTQKLNIKSYKWTKLAAQMPKPSYFHSAAITSVSCVVISEIVPPSIYCIPPKKRICGYWQSNATSLIACTLWAWTRSFVTPSLIGRMRNGAPRTYSGKCSSTWKYNKCMVGSSDYKSLKYSGNNEIAIKALCPYGLL